MTNQPPVMQTNEVLPTAALANVLADAQATAEHAPPEHSPEPLPDPSPQHAAPSTASSQPARHLRSGMLLGWCFWLLGSWVALWYSGGWTAPNIRLMVLGTLVGLMGVWPAVRLSQATDRRVRRRPRPVREERRRPRPPLRIMDGKVQPDAVAVVDDVPVSAWARACGGVWVDWFCLIVVFQAVLWPLQLAAGWSLAQAWWLNAAIAGWSLLTGLLIAWGRGTNRGGWRALAMVACVGLVVLEPALWWLGSHNSSNPQTTLRGFTSNTPSAATATTSPDATQDSRSQAPTSGGGGGGGWMRVSPLQTVWVLTTPGVRMLDNGSGSALDTDPPRRVGAGDADPSAFMLAQASVLSVSLAALAGWGVLWLLILGRAIREVQRGRV